MSVTPNSARVDGFPTTASTTSRLLLAGAAAGPLYCLVGGLQMLLRQGFDPTRHPLSVLANGEWGWIQFANFVVSGALVVAGAAGLWRSMRTDRGGSAGPLLLGLYGLGLIGAGVFVADPMEGFPPGTPAATTISPSGGLHFLTGGLGFFGLIGACLVFALHFLLAGRWAWAVYSLLTGACFFTAFAAIASGSKQRWIVVAFTAAVVGAWLWISAVMVRALRSTGPRRERRPSA